MIAAEGKPPGSSLLGISMRLPPSSLQAEQALLGAIMANNKAFHAVVDFLRAEHFADPIHATLYRMLSDRIAGGGLGDAVWLATRLQASEMLNDVGGNAYIAQLLSAMVGIINAADYGRIIADTWARRELISAGEDLVNAAFEGSDDVGAIMASAMQAIDNAQVTSTRRTPTVSLNAAMDEAIARAERAASGLGRGGLLTGFPSLDRAYNGMLPGTLHILAARPAMGKSALAWQIAIHAALACKQGEQKGGVFMQSLEMGAGELGERALSAFGGIPAVLLQRGEHQFHRSALAMAREELADLPLEIDETPALNIQQIGMRAREVHRKFGGLALAVVDHLHIVAHDPDAARRGIGPTQAIGEITRGLKKLSKDLRCPVLALAQLSRGVESRDDKRPTLSDLRQSGNIEEDADSVAFLYRPEYYLSKAEPEKKSNENIMQWQTRVREYDEQKSRLFGKAEVILEKVRGGAPQIVHMRWEAETTHFVDRSR